MYSRTGSSQYSLFCLFVFTNKYAFVPGTVQVRFFGVCNRLVQRVRVVVRFIFCVPPDCSKRTSFVPLCRMAYFGLLDPSVGLTWKVGVAQVCSSFRFFFTVSVIYCLSCCVRMYRVGWVGLLVDPALSLHHEPTDLLTYLY